MAVKELEELRRIGFEAEHETYGGYISSMLDVVKDRMVAEFAERHAVDALCEDDVVRCVESCAADSLRCFTRIYEYKEYDWARVLDVLKKRYRGEGEYGRNAVFQCIRRLCREMDLEYLKDFCDDEGLALLVGEHGRRNGFDASFFDDISRHVPSVFLGYTHLNALVLDSFGECFERLVGEHLDILDVLDYENKEVERAVVGSADRRVLEYVVERRLGSEDFLERAVCGARIDAELFLRDGCFGRLSDEGAAACLRRIDVRELRRIGVLGCRNKRVFRVLSRVLERVGEMGEDAVDILNMIVYHNNDAVFGDVLLDVSPCAGRDMLVERERGGRRAACVGVDGVIEIEGGSGSLEEMVEEEDVVEAARRRVAFVSALNRIQRARFEDVLRLPGFYFGETLRTLSHPFLDLVFSFDKISLPCDRRKTLLARRIEAMGFKDLLAMYLVVRNRYFRMELDFDRWRSRMSQDFKARYLRDFPDVLAGREDAMAEELGDCMYLLHPAPKAVEWGQDVQDAAGHQVGDDGVVEKRSVVGAERMQLKRAKTVDDLEELYSRELVGEDEHKMFGGRGGQICNEIGRRMARGESLEKLARTTSVLVRDDAVLQRILSTLYRTNRYGRNLADLAEFLARFLSLCRMEIEASSAVLDIVRTHIEESQSACVLYFVVLKARASDLEWVFVEFRDAGLEVMCRSICDRVAGKMSVEQSVARKGRSCVIDSAEMLPVDREEFAGVMERLLGSSDEAMVYVGLRGMNALGNAIDVEWFLGARSDRVVEEALRMERKATAAVNAKLMDILYRRGRLDALGKKCLRAINIDILEKEDVDRMYEMFFLDPVNYLDMLSEMVKRGYEISTEIAMELTRLLRTTHGSENVGRIVRTLRTVECSDEMAFESVMSLEDASIDAKMFLIDRLAGAVGRMSTQMFLKLCVCIGNESNYEVLGRLLQILRAKSPRTEIVEKWRGNASLRRLMLRIYPLYMQDREYYLGLLEHARESDRDEWDFISRFYGSELRIN